MTERALNDVMEFWHVIRVHPDGTITDSPEDPYLDEAARCVLVDPDTWEWREEINLPDGWELMNGYSGQHGYSGPVMHSSEFIGGGLERHIRETPGDYVALVVESDCNYTQEFCSEESGCDCEPAGWAVAFKPAELKDHGYHSLGKYSSARDDLLHYLCTSGWENDAFGDVEAPTGYVWKISNDPADVHIPNTEVTSLLEDWFTSNPEVTDSPELRSELVGHFIINEDSNGRIFVMTCPSAAVRDEIYSSLEARFNEWLGDDDEA